MLKILLVYPPNQLNPTETPRPDCSLGPLYLASALENAGLETDLVDASIGTVEDSLSDTFHRSEQQANGLIRIGMTNERIKRLIANGRYSVVGIHSNFTPQTRMAFEVAKAVKEVDPRILVISGGVNARNMAERFLQSGFIDAVCLSEGEKIIVALVKQWLKTRTLDNVNGIALLENGRFIRRPLLTDSIIQNLDDLPIPAWHKLPLERIAPIAVSRGDVLMGGKDLYASVQTSRGCPFWCSYCHISTEKGSIGDLRLKSIDRVLREFDVLRSLGVRRIYFEDESLFAKKERIRTIFRALGDYNLYMSDDNGVNLVHLFTRDNVTGRLRVDTEFLELLFNAGFHHVNFSIESGSQRILNKYASGKLNLATMDVAELVRATTKVGIVCPVGIMIGFPDETEEEIFQGVELGKRLVDAGAPYCSFYIVTPFPGSKLFDIALNSGHIDKDFDTDTMNWHRPIMVNTTITAERILELKNSAWRTVNSDDYIRERTEKSVSNYLITPN